MTIVADAGYINGDTAKLAKNTYRKRDASFSGMVFYFTPNGAFVSSYRYLNGTLLTPAPKTTIISASSSVAKTRSVNLTNNAATLKTQVVAAPDCIDWYWDTWADGELISEIYLYTVCGNDDGSGNTGGGDAPPSCSTPSGQFVALRATTRVVQPTDPTDPDDGGDPGYPDPDPGQSCNTAPAADTTKNPCDEKRKLSLLEANATVVDQNAQISTNTDTYEYGTNNRVASWQGANAGTIKPTPVTRTSAANTQAWSPHPTWNADSGYTIGFSHGHRSAGPSPADVFFLVNGLTSSQLLNAGADAQQYYRSNSFVNTLTNSDGNYMVTVNNWDTFIDLWSNNFSTQSQIDDFNASYEGQFYSYTQNNPNTSSAEAGVAAIMTLFGSTINVYHADTGSSSYSPIMLGTNSHGKPIVAPLPCN